MNWQADRWREYEMIRLQADDAAFSKYLDQVLTICDEALGPGLYTEERLQTLCGKENHYFYVVMAGKAVAGIFYCFSEQFRETEFAEHIHASFLSPEVKVGVAQSIALKHETRSQGVSEWLLNYGTRLLFEKEKVEAVLVPAWMKDGKIPARMHLEKCGYHLLQMVAHPWASYEHLRCPVCGTVPCSCDGAVYIRKREV